MRVIFVAAPLLGHVFPMVPLARALADAGHEVLLVTSGDGLGVRSSGLPVHDLGVPLRLAPIGLRMLATHPRTALAEGRGEAGTRGVGLLFGPVNDRIADAVVATVDQFAPDLVVHEPLAPAGALAAARLGVPAVRHETMLFDGRELVAAVAVRMGAALRRHRVDELPPPAGEVAVVPPSVVAQHGWRMRHQPYDGGGELPGWLAEPPEGRPRLLVSRSTLVGPAQGGLMSAVVAAADQVNAEIVLVRPDRAATRRPLPPNVRTVDWIPLAAALPAAAGIVHHGGAGTLLGAFAAGVPQFVVNGPGDRTHNGRLLAGRGAGIAGTARDLTPETLTRLLTDSALRRAADEVRRETADGLTPAEVVTCLVDLAG